MEQTWDAGVVRSGSAIVPAGWFPAAAEMCRRRPEIDMGVHLALTSESAAFRWSPISTADRSSGLIDRDGYMWPTVDEVRQHADPRAAQDELRAQIQRALDAGIDVTHLDHHMGAAVVPELVDGTVDLAIELGVPTLFPADIAGYVNDVNWDDDDLAVLESARNRLDAAGLAVSDRFWMGLSYLGDDVGATFDALLREAEPGLTYVSLHCATDGDVVDVHPNDAAWRIAEHALLTDQAFVEATQRAEVGLVGMRGIGGG